MLLVQLPTEIYRVLYLTPNNEIDILVTSKLKGRLTLEESEELLQQQNIQYKEVVKCIKHDIILELTAEQIEEYTIN